MLPLLFDNHFEPIPLVRLIIMFPKFLFLIIELLLFVEKTECFRGASSFYCDSCNNKQIPSSYPSNKECDINCECNWCTSTAMCKKLYRDALILNANNDTDYFVKNISEQIKDVCYAYRKEDWEHYTSLSKKTCGWYIENIYIDHCDRLICEQCTTNLICNKTKNIVKKFMDLYPSIDPNYKIAESITNYCSYGHKTNSSFFLFIIIFLFNV